LSEIRSDANPAGIAEGESREKIHRLKLFEGSFRAASPGKRQRCGLVIEGSLRQERFEASLASSFAPPLCLKLLRRQLATLEKKDFERLSWPVCGVIGHLEIGAEVTDFSRLR
jgi:hypothetical protein